MWSRLVGHVGLDLGFCIPLSKSRHNRISSISRRLSITHLAKADFVPRVQGQQDFMRRREKSIQVVSAPLPPRLTSHASRN